jgi:hypothetical protein
MQIIEYLHLMTTAHDAFRYILRFPLHRHTMKPFRKGF